MKYTHTTKDGKLAREIARIENKRTPRVFAFKEPSGNESIVTLTEDLRWSNTSPVMLEEWNEWKDVSIDTPIWVRNCGDSTWQPQHFAKYKDGKVFAFPGGQTSHSNSGKNSECDLVLWDFATTKPPKKGFDWKDVPVDTPIWVRNSSEEEWELRYFHSVDYTGAIFTWLDGKKSRDLKDKLVQKVRWNLAKLANK